MHRSLKPIVRLGTALFQMNTVELGNTHAGSQKKNVADVCLIGQIVSPPKIKH